MELVHDIERINRQRSGSTIGQLALAWVRYHNMRSGFPEVIPIPGSTTAERVEENCKLVQLTDTEYEEMCTAVGRCEIVGTRYP